MNRLRILKQRIARAGDVAVCKLSDGYAVATGRFQGDCSASMTKRAAINLAARWARPSAPQIMTIETTTQRTVIKLNPDGTNLVTSVTEK
jgi:hypothetical protein